MNWRSSWRRPLLVAASVLLLASALTACTVSVAGGLMGGLSGIVMLVFLLVGATTTQTGCDDIASPCLTFVEPQDGQGDTDAGPCLSIDILIDTGSDAGSSEPDAAPDVIHDVGPCLSVAPDAVAPDTVGPCLSVLHDTGEPDAVGPCLSVPHDTGSGFVDDTAGDTADGDDAKDAAGKKDVNTGPCLSPPAPDTSWIAPEQLQPSPHPATAPSRAAVRRKLADAGILPPDIAARFDKPKA